MRFEAIRGQGDTDADVVYLTTPNACSTFIQLHNVAIDALCPSHRIESIWTVGNGAVWFQYDQCFWTTKALASALQFFIWPRCSDQNDRNKQNATKTNNSALDLLGTNYRQICALLLLRAAAACCCTLLLIEKYKVFCKLLYLHESHAVERNLLIFDINKSKKNISHVVHWFHSTFFAISDPHARSLPLKILLMEMFAL